MNRFAMWLACICCGMLVLPATPALAASPDADADLDTFREDAQLNDVYFVDLQTGWAVGDRGVIWHTRDAGKNWSQQVSGVSDQLHCVQFLDANCGWIAGGTIAPYTHASQGVLLSTRDGGRRWNRERGVPFPLLKKIKFLDAQLGFAIGEPSALFPAGVLATETGGRSWIPLPGATWHGWLAGDFVDPRSGALAGRQGTLAAVRNRGLEPSRTPPFGLRGLKNLKLNTAGEGWMVGDGALILKTSNLGASWQTPPGEPPVFIQREFDFSALATLDAHCWIAGSPGTRILYSADGGQSWIVQATNQNLPIRGLAFPDLQHGYAVGALGTILATEDGGRSWKRQRGGGARAAVAGFYSDASAAPWELFAKLCAAEGYLGVIELLNRRDVEGDRPGEAHLADRTHQALIASGGCAAEQAWQFPLRLADLKLDADQIREMWNRATDGKGEAAMQAHLVRQIRIWRPDVCFTQTVASAGYDPAAELLQQHLLAAIAAAANPAMHPEQITQAGLQPWQVKKVYGSLPFGQAGPLQLETSQLAPRLGRSLAEHATLSRGLLELTPPAAPVTISFRLLGSTLAETSVERDFLSGIVLHPGGEARRMLREPNADSLELLRRAAQQQRNVQTILERSEQHPQQGTQLLGQVHDLVANLSGDQAAQVLFRLADRYRHSGNWSAAAETLDLLVARHPNHPLAPASAMWLVQFHASSEAAWREQRPQRVNLLRNVDMEEPASAESSGIRARGGSVPAIDLAVASERTSKALSIGKLLDANHPLLAAEPALRFPLAAAYRQQGLGRDAERFYLALRNSRPHDAWWSCAEGERWLAQPATGTPPKGVWQCVRVAAKPRLDGKLDDESWQRCPRIPLASRERDDTDWPAVAMLSYDGEFLYLAAQCRQAPRAVYPHDNAPRPRDADLSGHDRIDFFFDLDRDFVTCYRLTVDHRGWTGEDCWGDRAWNPTWFVAAQSADGAWTMEAAIPLEELTGQIPAARSAWAVGVQRTIPGVGFQSWTRPASTTPVPEGFGYLLFE